MDKFISTYKWCTECKRKTKHRDIDDRWWCEKCALEGTRYIKIYIKIYLFLMGILIYSLSTFTNTHLLEAVQYSFILITAVWWVGLPVMYIIISGLIWLFSK